MEILLPDAFYEILEDKRRYHFLKGSRMSGKTFAVKINTLLRVISEANHNYLVVVKYENKIRAGIFTEFVNLIRQWGLSKWFKITYSPYEIFYIPNNSIIRFYGVDNPEKLKGVVATSCFIDEVNLLERDEFDMLDLSIRAENGYVNQIQATFNPVSKLNWVYDFWCSANRKTTLLSETTWRDNPYRPVDTEDIMNRMKGSNPGLWLVCSEGYWGEESKEDAFFFNFDITKHVHQDVQYNPELPLWLSHDFNNKPYSACVISQFNGNTMNVVDEICLPYPNNRPKDVCSEFKRRYPNHTSGVKITGDVNGRSESSTTEAGMNQFKIILMELAKFRPQLQLNTVNPNVSVSGEFLNDVLYDQWGGLNIRVADHCKETVEDMINLKKDKNGDKLKQLTKKDENGNSWEKWGHTSDCLRYSFCYFFSREFKQYQRGEREEPIILGDHQPDPRFFY